MQLVEIRIFSNANSYVEIKTISEEDRAMHKIHIHVYVNIQQKLEVSGLSGNHRQWSTLVSKPLLKSTDSLEKLYEAISGLNPPSNLTITHKFVRSWPCLALLKNRVMASQSVALEENFDQLSCQIDLLKNWFQISNKCHLFVHCFTDGTK